MRFSEKSSVHNSKAARLLQFVHILVPDDLVLIESY